MKLIVHSDDYGLSYGVTDGILLAARNGILTETGLMTNLDSSEYAGKRMVAEFPHILLGQDINVVAGNPVSDPALIPSMVNPDGSFKTSGQHRALDKTHPNHITFEESCIEVESQVQKFIEITGRKPAYLHGHSYSCPNHTAGMKAVAERHGIRIFSEMADEVGVYRNSSWNKKPFTLEDQIAASPEKMLLSNELGFLDHDICNLHVHAGFVDQDIMDRSTYTIVRVKDLQCVISEQVKAWVKENNVELTNIIKLYQEKFPNIK